MVAQSSRGRFASLQQVRTITKIPGDNADQTGGIKLAHRSDAEELIHKIPPIEVDGPTAICDGGGGSLGHPLEYIRVNYEKPSDCLYCGLRYIKKKHKH